MKKLYCHRCEGTTEHHAVRKNIFGEESEWIGTRLFFGICSAGVSEFLADRFLECSECGKRRK